MGPDITLEDYRALAEFRHQLRRFLRFSEDAARSFGLETAQHQLLLAVMAGEGAAGPTIGELASRLQLRHHSVVELADRMAERGLIVRCRQPGDRRHVHIRLTPAGEATLQKLSLHHKAELRTAGPALVRALAAVISRAGQDSREHEGMAEPIETKP